MASIELQHVIKRYGRGKGALQVLHGIDAQIGDGEFVVIVGPSGCGKSTLLRMVAGLEEISEGQIRIGERVVNDLEPAQRDIAMVFQNYALYPHMSVFDNMAYGLKIAGVPRPEIQRRVDKAAGILELGAFLQRKPRELSGGQRQRVAMGRAIVREPQAFLFDEPLSNLDAKLRAQTRLEIRKLHRELGITSLFVTHDQVEAMTLADRIAVLSAGHRMQYATPDRIYNQPAALFVAGFTGAPPMNLVDCTLADGTVDLGGGVRVAPPRALVEAMTLAQRMIVMNAGRMEQFDTPETVYHRPASTFVASFIGSPPMNLLRHAPNADFGGPAGAILGIRPEHLVLADGGWPLQVDTVELLGAERLIHARLGDELLPVRTDEATPAPALGSTVHVRPLPDKLHWFDAATGRRIERA